MTIIEPYQLESELSYSIKHLDIKGIIHAIIHRLGYITIEEAQEQIEYEVYLAKTEV